MQTHMKILLVALFLVTTLPTAAHEGHGGNADTAFASVFHHYEALWEALAADSADGLAEHAEGIREAADAIVADWSTERAGLASGADAAEAAEFFDQITEAALLLGSAADLTAAREIFYDLSKPMVRLNELLAGERMKVVYCSMAKKSWLQRHEKIANPYHGKTMAGCGEIVAS